MQDYICYCFEYTESDIRDEVLRNDGRSLLVERIVEAKKKGSCQCETKNPRETCCMADVRRVVNKATGEQAQP